MHMFHSFNYIFWLMLFTLTCNQPLMAQSGFSLFTTAQGLSHNDVSAICQDSTGYMWIATNRGLNRFNGNQFVQYHSSDDSLSLPAEELTGAVWLDKYRLAFFSAGLHTINTKTGRTQNIFVPYHDKKYQFKFNMVMAARGDDEGNTYVLSRSGFYHFDSTRQLVSRFDYYTKEDVPVQHFFFGSALYELDEKKLLIVSTGGLYIYNTKQKLFRKMTAGDYSVMAEFLDYATTRNYHFFQPGPGEFFVVKSNSDSLCYINVLKHIKTWSNSFVNPQRLEFGWRSKLVKQNDSLYYVTGHYSGFFKVRFHRATGKVEIDSQKLFRNYLCNALMIDRDGTLWIGTNRGVFRQDRFKSLVQTIQLPPGVEDRFPNVSIYDLKVLNENIYLGTYDAGLFSFNKRNLQFQKQVLFAYDRTNDIRSLSVLNESELLLGTYGPLATYNTKNGKQKLLQPPQWHREGDWTSYIYEDRRGDHWISSNTIYRYHPGSGEFSIIPNHKQLLDVPFVMSEDRDGNIWMGCHGIARYNITTHQYDRYIDSFPFIKMPDKQVAALVVDDRNILWFNPHNNGLVAYDIDHNRFRHFTKEDGLPDDNISSLLALGNKIWIACYSGLACIDIHSLRIVSFGKSDGFPDLPTAGSSLYYDSAANQLYVNFSKAVSRFNPDSMLAKRIMPKLFIEKVVLNGRQYYYLPADTINASWKDDELQIAIGTINFFDGESQRFAYRIYKNDSSSWIDIGNQSSFTISGLSPGKHLIQVKTYSSNHRWMEQVKDMMLIVQTPFWQMPWFYALGIIALMVLIFLVVQWRTTIARKKEMVKTQLESIKAAHYKNQFELEQISNYFSSSLAAKKSVDDVLWGVAHDLIGRMDYEDCVIYLWNPDKTKMLQKAAWGPKGKPGVISDDAFEVAPGQGIVGEVITSGQPVLVKDTRKDPRYRVDDDFRFSEVAVPILHDNEVLGVIDSEHSEANYFSERDIKILTTIATLIGNKLKQMESEQSLEAKQKELLGINEQLAEARLSALQAQMNPHFVFNALNSIKRMILDSENEKASRYLSKFALMIRMTLEHSKQLFVSLDENIEYLRAYLDMEQLRFDDSFKYIIETDDQVDTTETVLPSMMIQPLVENAIWHGLMYATNDKKIRIAFSQTDSKMVCTIEDNGIGIGQSEKLRKKHRPLHRSVGLENLQKRIKIMNEKYGTDCSLQIVDLSETGGNVHGTRVTLQFKLMNT
jgi:putative methionine-R-sulfoxide reductase with GAF domain